MSEPPCPDCGGERPGCPCQLDGYYSDKRFDPHAEIRRSFCLYWVEMHYPKEGGIGTSADYGPALTIWGARRRARRAIRNASKGRKVEVVSGL